MTNWKLAGALLLVLGGSAILAKPKPAAAQSGDCIYAAYILGETCFGETIRFCKGPPECIKQQ